MGRLSLRLTFFLLFGVFPLDAVAQPAPPRQPASEPQSEPRGTTPTKVAPIADDAAPSVEQQLAKLRKGNLDPAVDLGTVFSGDVRSVSALLRGDGTEAGASADAARLEFLSLPTAVRRRALRTHEKRRATAREKERQAKRDRAALESLKKHVAHLEAFLAAAPTPDVDLTTLFVVDTAAPDELVLNGKRRARYEGLMRTASEGGEFGDPPADLSGLELARLRLDRARARLATLSDERLQELIDAHEKSKLPPPLPEAAAERLEKEADTASLAVAEVTQAKKRAREEAAQAKSEALRILGDYRVKLYETKESLVRYDAELKRAQVHDEERRELALGLSRRVHDLDSRSFLEGDKTADAARLHRELAEALSTARNEFEKALGNLSHSTTVIPDLPPRPAPEVLSGIDTATVDSLEREVSAERNRLFRVAAERAWESANVQRDAMVTMNAARLSLTPILSSEKRHQLESFAGEGLTQATREFRQISLEARYHLVALPREINQSWNRLRTSPVVGVLAFLKLLLAIVIFRWWRRRGDGVFDVLLKSLRKDRKRTGNAARFVWYMKRSRRPLEWLLLAAIVIGVVGTATGMGELRYLTTVLLWTFLGTFCIQLFNAMGERSGRKDDIGELRLRSLRLVGLSFVGIGLLRSLTDQAVGQGTIYSWMTTLFVLVFAPVLVTLVWWWRPIVDQRMQEERRAPGLREWYMRGQNPASRFFRSGVAGAVLLARGIGRFVLARFSSFSTTQRLLAYLFRREIEKQVAARRQDTKRSPISDELRARILEPASTGIVETYAQDLVDEARSILEESNNAVAAIVGEPGVGKTVFMDRVLSVYEPNTIIRIDCKPGGFKTLLHELAERLGLEQDSSVEEVAASLSERAPKAVCIDNAQRLIRPLIGGLKDVDELFEFALRVGPPTSWLIAADSPAWRYLTRAHAERAVFDRELRLPAWSEAQIAELIQKRTDAVGISPSFDTLVVPQKMELHDPEEEEATERDYYRILWDFAAGNPSVALYFWCDSLFHGEEDEYVVHLFESPAPTAADELPQSVLFVLRAILQMELATAPEITRCTDFTAPEVADALRVARTRGFVDQDDGRYRIDLRWYRTITRTLVRQHLLRL